MNHGLKIRTNIGSKSPLKYWSSQSTSIPAKAIRDSNTARDLVKNPRQDSSFANNFLLGGFEPEHGRGPDFEVCPWRPASNGEISYRKANDYDFYFRADYSG